MEKIQLQTEISRYSSTDELSDDDRKLLEQAKAAVQSAYAPYSDFFVGAAVRLVNGQVIIGNNQENASFTVGICAERVALFAAAANYPETPVEAVAITAMGKHKKVAEPIPPCGACRQALIEYELRYDSNIRLIITGDSGDIYLIDSVKDILPLGFSSKYLDK